MNPLAPKIDNPLAAAASHPLVAATKEQMAVTTKQPLVEYVRRSLELEDPEEIDAARRRADGDRLREDGRPPARARGTAAGPTAAPAGR